MAEELAALGAGEGKREPQLTGEQLHVLQHALGVDQFGCGEMYRNLFCAGGTDVDICRELVAMGLMETFTRSYLPYYNCRVTEAGKVAMLGQSPKPPNLSRAQKRYRQFLEADTGYSFMEWLKVDARRRKPTPGPSPAKTSE